MLDNYTLNHIYLICIYMYVYILVSSRKKGKHVKVRF